MTMDKYAVVLDDEKEKQAERDKGSGKCPECGKPLDEGGACPDHGTEPMEKKHG